MKQDRNLKVLLLACLNLGLSAQDISELDTFKIEYVVFKYPQFKETEEKFQDKTFNFLPTELFKLKILSSDLKVNNSSPNKLSSSMNNQENNEIEFKPNSAAQNSDFNYEDLKGPHFQDYYLQSLDVLEVFERRAIRRDDISILQQGSWMQIPNTVKSLKRVLHNENSLIYLNFYKDRYLHVDLNAFLDYETLEETIVNNTSYENILDRDLPFDNNNLDMKEKLNPTLPIKIKSRFWITEDRKVFNEDVHYFDHPAFGVLVSITKISQ